MKFLNRFIILNVLHIFAVTFGSAASDLHTVFLGAAKADSESRLWIQYLEAKQKIAIWNLREIEMGLNYPQGVKKLEKPKSIQSELALTEKIEKKIPEIRRFGTDCIDKIEGNELNLGDPNLKKCKQLALQLFKKFRAYRLTY